MTHDDYTPPECREAVCEERGDSVASRWSLPSRASTIA